ncbi:DUF2922 domain-containing protein [Limosilactobacillus oris]|uniref:DUF2922 domain-containing protein n=1 Tax=Limosilactobacillus oris TaxID=1632 RepID=UPI0018845AFF|nr:DUF2922 domain-containing protein [Limosilactobacillus oris]MBF0601876.1 DUF2922 domain-containing protein [Limosilactobacillus oris]
METYLKLKFKSSLGKSTFMKIANPKKDLTKEKVLEAMQNIAAASAFIKEDTDLYVTPVSAKYVTTTEKAVVEEQVN